MRLVKLTRDPDKFSRGALLTVNISGNAKSVRWHPFRQGPDLRPRLCTGDTKVEDLQRLNDLSAALLNKNDFRHALADSVVQTGRRTNLDRLGIREVIRLALKPKWRYVPRGLNWLFQRMKFVKEAQ